MRQNLSCEESLPRYAIVVTKYSQLEELIAFFYVQKAGVQSPGTTPKNGEGEKVGWGDFRGRAKALDSLL